MRELQPEVARGPDIGAAEREDQVDLGAPPPDALEADQSGESEGIVGVSEPDEIKFAARDRSGQPAGVIHLLSAETTAPQRSIVEGKKRLWQKRVAQPDEPAVHRRGGVDRDLLFEDDV